jgi:hypothetical protein
MARPSIKSTYSLDTETVKLLERTARRWGVSKSEALRRAIRAAANEASPGPALAILDRLQQAAGLRPEAAARWVRENRAERRATRPGR